MVHSLVALFSLTAFASCARTAPPTAVDSVSPAQTARVMRLPLAPPLDAKRAELSDLAWHGDDLFLLPQYPERFPSGPDGSLFMLRKAALREAIDTASRSPLVPMPVPFDTGDL